jgi:tetratricopeptide (TPR) repeat protein
MNALAVIVNLVFPGIGLILVGQKRAGILFAFLFCLAVDGVLLSPPLIGGRACRGFVQAFAFLAVVLWLWSLIRLLTHVRFLSGPAFVEQKEALFRQGMELYLKNRLVEAKEAFVRLLAMDAEDADGHLYLGLVYKNLRQPAHARACFRRCTRYDYQLRWRWEIAGVLQELKGRSAR